MDCHLKDEPHKTNLGRACADCHQETAWAEIKPYDHAATKFALDGRHKDVPCRSCHIGEIYKDLPTDCVACHRVQDVHDTRFGEKCATCHAPSKWSEVRFEHDRDTDFKLTGKHVDTKCEACHTGAVEPAKQGNACIDCHREDDAHKTQLGPECATCHKTSGWRDQVAFDHDITRFPLIGQHVLAPCEECHIDTTFGAESVTCISCHKPDDPHVGQLGDSCETCHTPNGWEFWSFDHNRQTEFTLQGAHVGLQCEACQTPGRATKLTPKETCVSCHRQDDVHKGRFGTNCLACHTDATFKGAKLR